MDIIGELEEIRRDSYGYTSEEIRSQIRETLSDYVLDPSIKRQIKITDQYNLDETLDILKDEIYHGEVKENTPYIPDWLFENNSEGLYSKFKRGVKRIVKSSKFKKLATVGALSLFGLSLTASPVIAGDNYINITDRPGDQINPDIYEDKVVYVDAEDSSIHVYDLSKKQDKKLVDINPEAIELSLPRIFGNKIVYADGEEGHLNLYLFDLDNNQNVQITDKQFDEHFPDIYGNNIVYNGEWPRGIFVYNIKTGEEKLIPNTDSLNMMSPPVIYKNKVLLSGIYEWEAEVFTYDISTATKDVLFEFEGAFAPATYPAFHGDKIAWWNPIKKKIRYYDLITKDKIDIDDARFTGIPIFEAGIIKTVDIYGDKIVFLNRNEGENDFDLFTYDTNTRIINNVVNRTGNQINPAIYKDTIVWQEYGDILAIKPSSPIDLITSSSNVPWIVGGVAVSAIFTGLGFYYLRKRKKPPESSLYPPPELLPPPPPSEYLE